MPFQLVYLSQQDPKWKTDILGFGDPGDTIGYIGCALTATAMLLSGHGYSETPKTLNQKLKNAKGFVSAAIMWSAVNKIYPNVSLKAYIPCSNSDAPLAQIDAAIATGQPAIVQVDRSPASGIQTHWVVLYQRKGDDYLMLDPWPYQPDITKEDFLMKRYAQGRTLKHAISHVILYEAYGSGGPISTPLPAGQPTTDTTPMSGPSARVKAEVTWGLNLRSSVDTSGMANVIAVLPAGTQLLLLESDGYSRVGAINQMLRARTQQGQEGFVAAWYLEKVTDVTPPVVTEPAPAGPVSEASEASTSTPVTPPVTTSESPATSTRPEPPKEDKLAVVVSSFVGSSGLRLRKTASKSGDLVLVLKAGTRLTVIEPAGKAKAKIGKANQWIYVREPNGKRGYVGAEFVTLQA
jgi:hypothetical protein